MKRAFVRFAPVAIPEMLDRIPNDPERLLYDRCRLKVGARVLVSHDRDQPVGYVRELCRHADELGLWHMAVCDIDTPPEWLKKGTAVSVGGKTISNGTMLGREIKRDCLVTEISIVGPGREPKEPLAKVCTLRDIEIGQPRSAPPLARITREVADPWLAPSRTLSELGPLTEKNALQHWDARMEAGEDPTEAFLDIQRKLAKHKHDQRLGRRSNIRHSGRTGMLVGRETLRRDCGTILGVS